jgi:hypothetical protein
MSLGPGHVNAMNAMNAMQCDAMNGNRARGRVPEHQLPNEQAHGALDAKEVSKWA